MDLPILRFGSFFGDSELGHFSAKREATRSFSVHADAVLPLSASGANGILGGPAQWPKSVAVDPRLADRPLAFEKRIARDA